MRKPPDDPPFANFTKNRSINTGISLAPGEKGTMRLPLPHREGGRHVASHPPPSPR